MATVTFADFEWEEAKNALNLAKHRITFEQAISLFSSNRIEQTVVHKPSGEMRKITVGKLENGWFATVVYTERGKRTRIISARRARKNEKEAYIRAVS